ncbi:ADP-ribosylation factor family-domain-containing protein, partial [Mycena galopus ATCC 62051]
ILGLDAAGKTTLLYRLKTGEIVTTIPTIGLNVEKIQARAGNGRIITMWCWDVGGCGKLPASVLRPYTSGSDALIWVVHGSDRERMAESVEELTRHIHSITSDPTYPNGPNDLPVLI